MSGVDGAVKLNSFRAPSTKISETVETVSEFAVQEEKIEETTIETITETVEDVTQETIEETIQEIVTKPCEEGLTEENFEPIIIEKTEEEIKPKKKNKVDIKTLFLSVENIVQKMYLEVFSKTPEFKPTFETVMGDIILYLSKKLSLKNADNSFNDHFGLTGKVISDKYSNGYIPYALKLSKWCSDNGKMSISDELLFAISTVYLESAKLSDVIITELELANDFETEISFTL